MDNFDELLEEIIEIAKGKTKEELESDIKEYEKRNRKWEIKIVKRRKIK